MVNKHSLWLAGTLAILVMAGCGPSSSQDNNTTDSLTLGDVDSVETLPPDPCFDHRVLPDARTVARQIVATGADYDETLPNSLEKEYDYLLSESKASFNLGIYLTDALYLNGYDKASEYIRYSMACRRLAGELGTRESFASEMTRRMESNLGKRDSIFAILDSYFVDMLASYQAGGQREIATLMTTGSLVESLYILTNIASRYPDDKNLAETILRQQEAIRKMTVCIRPYANDPTVDAVIAGLTKLESKLAAAHPHRGLQGEELKAVTALAQSLRTEVVN